MPRVDRELRCLRGVHVPDDPTRLSLRVAPVDREQRHVDAEAPQGRRQLVRDDRVAGVVDARRGVEDVPDKAGATPYRTPSPYASSIVTPWNAGTTSMLSPPTSILP